MYCCAYTPHVQMMSVLDQWQPLSVARHKWQWSTEFTLCLLTDRQTDVTASYTHHVVVNEGASYDLLKCNENGVTWVKRCFIVRNGLGPFIVLTAKLLNQGLNATGVG